MSEIWVSFHCLFLLVLTHGVLLILVLCVPGRLTANSHYPCGGFLEPGMSRLSSESFTVASLLEFSSSIQAVCT